MIKMKSVTIVLIMLITFSLSAQVEADYVQDGKQVKITRYHDNGEVKETGIYVNGKPDGKWYQYNEEGQLVFEANYVGGIKDGKWFRWDNEGAFLYELVYNDGTLADVHKWKLEERNMLAGK